MAHRARGSAHALIQETNAVKTEIAEKAIIFVDGSERWILPLEEAGASVPHVGDRVHLPLGDDRLVCYEVAGVEYFYRKVPHDPWKYVAPLSVQVRLKKEP
jgi:hypothetical protein